MGRAIVVVMMAMLGGVCAVGCDDNGGDSGDRATSSLWVRVAVENEVGLGATAYVTLYDGDSEGESLELEEGGMVTCNGKSLEVNVEVWSRITYYKAVAPDLGEGGSYGFVFTRGSGEVIDEALTLPSKVMVEDTPTEVQPGRDVTVGLSSGSADELQVALVAPCLSLAEVSLDGDAETATIPGDQVRCACEGGGNTPPCDALIRAQRISRGEVGEAFAGGETLGVQRHEVDVPAIPE